MANRAKSREEKIAELTAKIDSLNEQKAKIENQIADATKKRNILQSEVDNENFKSLMALGLSMDELMKCAKEKAEEKELKKLEEEEKKVTTDN